MARPGIIVKEGMPVAGDFASSDGSPLVIDSLSSTGYYFGPAGVQQLAGGPGGSGGYLPFFRYDGSPSYIKISHGVLPFFLANGEASNIQLED